ncbi:MAG: S41 family peptidase [Colwellia sp.]|nr:S41 family peptidase [Colwellia sp.]
MKLSLNNSVNKTLSAIILTSTVLLSACGGSNGSYSTTTSNTYTWVAGTFVDDSKLDNLCIGTSNGSALTEKLWLRSWSDDTYLWYNEIDDQSPAAFSISDYFSELKTNALTPSGKLKDQFHFSMSTQEWNLLNQSGASLGFGINYHFQQKDVSLAIPRKITISYTDPNTPASIENISRGTIIIAVDGVNVESADDDTSIATLNNGLFPESEGQEVVFTLQNFGESESFDITLIAEKVVSTPVQHVKTIDTDNGKVGYLQFNSHIATAEKGLVDAITDLEAENISDLVLDLRYNGGGLLDLASQLGYMIAGEATIGKTFEKLTFNDKYPTKNPVTGSTLQPSPFHSQTIGFNAGLLSAGQGLPTLNLTRLFVLTTANTCSASESLMNSLRGIDIEVIQIGETTCGKPYGFYPTPNCGTTYFSVQFKGENEQGFGDYADGFMPSQTPSFQSEVQGCVVVDDFSKTLGDETEALLAAALIYSADDSRTCPEVSANKQARHAFIPNITDSAFILEDKRPQSVFFNNRIVTPK